MMCSFPWEVAARGFHSSLKVVDMVMQPVRQSLVSCGDSSERSAGACSDIHVECCAVTRRCCRLNCREVHAWGIMAQLGWALGLAADSGQDSKPRQHSSRSTYGRQNELSTCMTRACDMQPCTSNDLL
jgi:hypothetical protein